jgi:hypothetical protein
VLAPIAWRTPPRHYGPWELFASLLADGLADLGHDVTLFATADSFTTARLHPTAPGGWSETDGIDPKVAECLHIAAVFERAADFDVIHNGFDFLPLTYSGLVDTPVVTTIHGFSSPRIVEVYERYDATNAYVAISDADRHPALHYAATIHHGIDVDAFHLDPSPGEHRSSSQASCTTSTTSGARWSRISTAAAFATSVRSTPWTGRVFSVVRTRCCTSSTSTSRSVSAWSRRSRAERP